MTDALPDEPARQPVAEPVSRAPLSPEFGEAGAVSTRPAGRPASAAEAAAATPDEQSGIPARRVLALLVFVAVVFWLARPVLAPFVIAAFIAYAFTPVVAAVQARTGVRRGFVVIGLYLTALLLIGLLIVLIGERLAAELQLLATSGPNAVATLLRQFVGSDRVTIGGTELSVQDLANQLQTSITSALATPSSAIHLATQVVEVGLQGVLALIVTFYFMLDGVRLRDAALRFLAPRNRARALTVGGNIHQVLGRWLRGQVLLIGLVAVVVYVILGPILHVPYALALGILTGVLEIIPLVGPIIAATIAAVIAFSAGGSSLAITVIVIYVVIRQVEDQVVMPVVIGRAVHLHPVVTIFAVLVGISAWGILGGLLAVPVAAAINVTLHEFYPEATEPLE